MDHTITNRGFKHMDPLYCKYNSEVKVYESSAVVEPCIWLKIKVDPNVLHSQASGEGTAHLTLDQAEFLIKKLQWLIENHYQIKE